MSPLDDKIGFQNPLSVPPLSVIPGDPCVLHPGIVHKSIAQPESGSAQKVPQGDSLSLVTQEDLSSDASVTTNRHHVPLYSNLHSHRLSTLPMTIGLLCSLSLLI